MAEQQNITEMARESFDDQNILAICDALNNDQTSQVEILLEELGPADSADLLEKIGHEERNTLLTDFTDSIDPQTYAKLDAELRRAVLSEMEASDVAAIISALDSDDALDLIINLDDEFQHEIMRKLSAKMRLTLEEGLSFPEDSAGRLMQREFVAVPNFWTVGKTVDYLREAAEELPSEFFDVFVIDPAYHITGQIPLNQLIRAKRSTRLTDIMEDDLITIPATMDQEDVAYQFRHDELVSAPVVDENGRLIGTITIDDVVSVIDEEAQEDILKMAGVEHGDLYRAVLSTTGTRFRWLFINLITAILASIVISFFDATIEQLVALAVLMPIVASMGGNAGTQTLTVAVRALAMKEISGANTLRIIWKESLVGSLNGILFALITGTITALWFTNPMLGIVIGLAMIVNMLVAGLFGAAIPIALSSRGADPAVSSTVFLTTLTDIVGFFVFLGLAAMLLI